MRSFTSIGADESNPEKFVGYMVPKPEEVVSTTSLRDYALRDN